MVYQVQKEIIIDLKLPLLYLSHVTYFSDGFSGQYVTLKICATYATTSLTATQNAKLVFFGTTHWNHPCDGTGGTVKQLVSNASLQCINNYQILNPDDMFQYCENNIQGIIFIFITKDEMNKTRESLEDRFAKAITIPSTREYHEFIPLSENTTAMKYCSKDQEVATTFSFSNEDKVSDAVKSNKESSQNVKAIDFVSCYYENYYKFMHFHVSSPSFVWPFFEDNSWVLNNHILCKTDSPTTKTGRSYVVSEADIIKILSKLD